MTDPAEQMAHELWEKLSSVGSIQGTLLIAAALREYGEACVKEYRSIKPAEEDWSDIYDLGEQKGRRSALLEAAKVAELLPLNITPRAGEQIANQIRALLKPDEEGITQILDLDKLRKENKLYEPPPAGGER